MACQTRYYSEPYQALFYTDRPVYRPGQTVYFKGILRVDDDAHYSLPEPGTEIDVVVERQPGAGRLFGHADPLGHGHDPRRAGAGRGGRAGLL